MVKEKKQRDKRVNSKNKGDGYERKVCNLFKKNWGVTAYRTPGSGAYTSRQVSRAMKEAAVGDIVIEELPELLFECKNYYSLHFSNWFKDNPKKESIYCFWEKLVAEAIEFKKIPILICKENSSPNVCIVSLATAGVITSIIGTIKNFFSMNKGNTHLTAFSLDELLQLDIETIKLIINNIHNNKKGVS